MSVPPKNKKGRKPRNGATHRCDWRCDDNLMFLKTKGTIYAMEKVKNKIYARHATAEQWLHFLLRCRQWVGQLQNNIKGEEITSLQVDTVLMWSCNEMFVHVGTFASAIDVVWNGEYFENYHFQFEEATHRHVKAFVCDSKIFNSSS